MSRCETVVPMVAGSFPIHSSAAARWLYRVRQMHPRWDRDRQLCHHLHLRPHFRHHHQQQIPSHLTHPIHAASRA